MIGTRKAHDLPAVKRLCEWQNVSAPTNPDFKKLVRTNYLDQAFRAFLAMGSGFPDDTRAWDYFSVFQESYYRRSMWTCTFFMLMPSSKQRARFEKSGFFTAVAMNLERTLYVMSFRFINDYTDGELELHLRSPSEPQHKRRPPSPTARKLPPLKLNQDGTQRIGLLCRR